MQLPFRSARGRCYCREIKVAALVGGQHAVAKEPSIPEPCRAMEKVKPLALALEIWLKEQLARTRASPSSPSPFTTA
jgi:hypothetical protein